MKILSGLAASPGIAFGKALIYSREKPLITKKHTEKPASEITRLREAISTSFIQLESLKARVNIEYGEEFAHIFRSQQTITEDESILEEITTIINEAKLSAESAVDQIFKNYITLFSDMPDDNYNKARIADLEDVYGRIINNLTGKTGFDLGTIPENTAIVSEDLLPSDTAVMDKKNIACFITEKGGITSHVAILAKTMGIPASVKVKEALKTLKTGEAVILDASDPEKGEIIASPDNETIEKYTIRQKKYNELKLILANSKDLPPETLDKHKMIFSGNIGSPSDMESALSFGTKSIGLFRSEFLFMGSPSLPDEETQFNAYRSVAEKLSGGMVIIRTLDIGGDKSIKSFNIPKEENPFLGYRALRICLREKEMFKTQLRAILRSSSYGDVRIMFPMISCVSELREAKALLEGAKDELRAKKIRFNEDIETGIMVEIPSAVFSADSLIKECSFFSIGTNDLTQYLFAADRLNENVSEYYRPFHPALFRAIKAVADAAEKAGKWCGICGELGGMGLALPVLAGLGVKELSMTPQLLPENIYKIRKMYYNECKKLADEVLKADTQEDVKKLLVNFAQRLS